MLKRESEGGIRAERTKQSTWRMERKRQKERGVCGIRAWKISLIS